MSGADKSQPWKDALAGQDISGSSIAPQSDIGEGDLMRCQGFKVMKLEKLILDSQKQIESEPGAAERERLDKIVDDAQKEIDGVEPNDLFRCMGGKVMKLEKLILDSKKDLEAGPDAANQERLEKLISGAQKEIDTNGESEEQVS